MRRNFKFLAVLLLFLTGAGLAMLYSVKAAVRHVHHQALLTALI